MNGTCCTAANRPRSTSFSCWTVAAAAAVATADDMAAAAAVGTARLSRDLPTARLDCSILDICMLRLSLRIAQYCRYRAKNIYKPAPPPERITNFEPQKMCTREKAYPDAEESVGDICEGVDSSRSLSLLPKQEPVLGLLPVFVSDIACKRTHCKLKAYKLNCFRY